MTRVSYIVTFYNKEKFIPFVLASLAAQHGAFEREFIFVDDGSSDRTVEHLRAQTADWRKVTILTQANAGPAVATNRGIAVSAGEIIKILDGDDLLSPVATLAFLKALEDCRVGAAVSYRKSFYDPDTENPAGVLARFPGDYGASHVHPEPMRQLVLRPTANPTAWIVRRELLDRVGRCDEGVFIQDYSLELRIATAGPIAEVDAMVIAYPKGAPGRLSENQAQILHDVNLAALRFLRSQPSLRRDFLHLAMRRAAKRALAWEQRHGSLARVPYLHWLYGRSLLGMLTPTEAVEEALCAPFRATGRVRLSNASSSI